MTEYILRGDERHVDAILRENALRIANGWVEFVPSNQNAEESKEASATDTKEVSVTDTKKSTRKSK